MIIGVGALRTDWAEELARGAEHAGTDGLLLAAMSYTPLKTAEVAEHYRAVARATGLPLCIYNNPGTTRFAFSSDLLAEVATMPGVAAVKMPLPSNGDFAGEIARLRERTPSDFAIGYSGDWGAGPSLLAGADAFYSALAGILPQPMLRLAHAAQAGRLDEVAKVEEAFAPMWRLFRSYGGLRIIYTLADLLGLRVGDPPLPVRRVGPEVAIELEAALRRVLSEQREVLDSTSTEDSPGRTTGAD